MIELRVLCLLMVVMEQRDVSGAGDGTDVSVTAFNQQARASVR